MSTSLVTRKGRLDGKIAVITGAGQGIGRASAILFAQEGAKVIATDIDVTKLAELAKIEGVIKTVKLDVTNKNDIVALAKTITRVDVIFNCAGIVPGGTILDCDEATWDKSLDLNAKGAFLMCQALIPVVLKEGNTCSIVNMSSVASSLKGVVNRFAYSVSKGALNALTKSIAADFIGQKIRANTICPGTVDTPSFRDRVSSSPDPNKAMVDFLARQKMGRLGTAEEIAALALYLASDEAAYVTGQDFIIDGGWCL